MAAFPRTVQAFRRFLAPFVLVKARLATRPARTGLVAVGLAAGAAALAALLAGSLVAEERGLANALERVAPHERALRVGWSGVPAQGQGKDSLAALDTVARRALRALTEEEPVRVMLYRQTRFAGHLPEGKLSLADLGAVDGLARWLRARSGRLPRPCTRARCEVVQVGGTGPVPAVPGLKLVRVGEGRLTSRLPFGRIAPPGAYGAPVDTVGARVFLSQPEPPPFLVAEGVAGLARTPRLASIYRSYAWVVPLGPGAVPPWAVTDFAAGAARVSSEIQTASPFFDLVAPVSELRAAQDTSRVAARRLLLLGGEGVALLVAFGVLAAASMRRDLDAARRRLASFGARRSQLVLLTVGEAAGVAAAATLLGWGAGIGIAAGVADAAGSPVGSILSHSVVSPHGLGFAAALAAASALALLGSLWVRPVRVGMLSLSALDVAALGALAAVLVALTRGEAEPRSLASETGSGTFLLLLPGLVAFVLAVAVARALGPALRLFERVARRRSASARIAALSLARRPGHAAIAVTFLMVTLGLSLFVASYRSTLERGQRDQAAFAVPLDFVVREDLSRLVAPLEAASLGRYRAIAPGTEALAVTRLSGSASGLGRSRGATLLGIPAEALRKLRWRDDFASLTPSELGSRIAPARPVELHGPVLPLDATELLLPAAVRGDDLVLSAGVVTSTGRFAQVELGQTKGRRLTPLAGRVPARARGGRIVSLVLGLTPISRETGEPIVGELALGSLAARSPRGRTRLVSGYRDWVGVDGVEPADGGSAATVRYFVTNQATSRFRPRQPTDGRPVPVIGTPALAEAAGRGGVLPIQLAGSQISVRVVATARRFPSVEGDFVVADERLLETAVRADAPGFAVANEIWLGAASPRSAATVERALELPPFDALDVESRRALEAELRGDPLARSSIVALAVAAGVAFGLALIGLALAVVGDLRDDRGDLFDLEAQGMGPPALRRHLRLRAGFAAVLGAAGGLGLGAILTALVVDLVVVTAAATSPDPPLRLDFDWPLAGGAAAAYAALAAAVVWAVTRRAFRAPAARPTGGREP